jgi:hypothetical protein
MNNELSRTRLTLLVVSLILLLLSTGSTFLGLQASDGVDGWSSLATGIEYQLFHLTHPRPINLHVARMHRSESSVIIDTAIAQGSLVEGRETTGDMASRYDQAINFWGQTWGNRNRVVVAINGYYFDLKHGTPLSGQISSGWYAQRFSDYVGDAGFAWNMDRNAYIGKCVFHTPRDQFITVLRSGATKKIGGINVARGIDELILYTPQYDASTGTDNNGVEILVEMERPSLVLPEPAMAKGKVVQIRDIQGNTPIPFDHVVLSATGMVRNDLLNKVQVGDEIGISQEIDNCLDNPPVNWTKTYSSMGGDYHFLTAGIITIDDNINPDALAPNSRTAVAFNPEYVYFVVVDGWNHGVSEGITINELGIFTRDTLAASDAVTLDSGGSSTMVIYGQVVNNTYCNLTHDCGMQATGGEERPSSFTRNPEGIVLGAGLPENRFRFYPADDMHTPTILHLEQLVGNALFMATVEPKVKRMIFNTGKKVLATRVTTLRLGPGSNYSSLANVPDGAQGTILAMHYNDLGGVFAKGSYWERVEMNGLSGWIPQEDLGCLSIPWPPGMFLPLVLK